MNDLYRKFFHLSIVGCLILSASTLSAGIIENAYFSRKSYASSIQEYGWLVTADQVAESFRDQEDPVQLSFGQLNKKPLFLALRFENLEPFRAWGTLDVRCPGLVSTVVDVTGIAPRAKGHQYYIIHIGNHAFPQSWYDEKPEFCFRWKKLYVQ